MDGRRLGVEFICRLLQVAPSSYYAVKTRSPSARTISDAVLIPELVGIWEDNYRVYVVRKLWRRLGAPGSRSVGIRRAGLCGRRVLKGRFGRSG